MNRWHPGSWRDKPVKQLPTYKDQAALKSALEELASYPPLIFSGEALELKARLANVAAGKAFLLQGGDCAESFSQFRTSTIRDNLRVLLQMAVVLTFGGRLPVVKVGRVAGQFAKPRSEDTETREGKVLPTYRGDIINGFDFDAAQREPDPARMLRAYLQSASTLNMLRALSRGGFADLRQVHAWNVDFVGKSGPRYEAIASRIDEALSFMSAMGIEKGSAQVRQVELYTSHEALLLPYEEALTQRDEDSDRWFGCSAHMLWLGERTRQLDGAHVEYLRGISNPIGIKIGPSCTPDDLMRLLDALDPDNEPGRCTLIARMGVEKAAKALPPLLEAARKNGRVAIWSSDPMHGNTRKTSTGFKTRAFEDVVSEIETFLGACQQAGVTPGGVHLELTGEHVVECIGGHRAITEEQLAGGGYETLCDPRLNVDQALELAFRLAQVLERP